MRPVHYWLPEDKVCKPSSPGDLLERRYIPTFGWTENIADEWGVSELGVLLRRKDKSGHCDVYSELDRSYHDFQHTDKHVYEDVHEEGTVITGYFAFIPISEYGRVVSGSHITM